MNYKLRIIIARLLNFIIKVIYFIPLGAVVKSKAIAKLSKLKLQISPKLFDDSEFLSYVQKKKLGLEKNLENIKTLALMSSTTDYGFYSPLLKNSYNLGLSSANLYTSYHLYNNYRNQLSNLQNVIIYCSVFSPGFSLIRSSERYRLVAYKYFFDVQYEKNQFIIPEYEKHIIKKCKRLSPREFDHNYMGYDKKTLYNTNVKVQDRTRLHLRENKREPDQLKWLKNLGNLVKEDGRKLFIVFPPYRSDYKNLLPSDSILFEKILNLNLDGVEILNYYNSEIFIDSDFGDTDHLNEDGSIKLTNEIMKVFKNNKWL